MQLRCRGGHIGAVVSKVMKVTDAPSTKVAASRRSRRGNRPQAIPFCDHPLERWSESRHDVLGHPEVHDEVLWTVNELDQVAPDASPPTCVRTSPSAATLP